MNSDNKINIILGLLFLTVITAVWSIFKRDDGVISEKGKKILSNKNDKAELLKAFREGKKEFTYETKNGETVYIK